jgi:predicted metal-binding membrane protein
MALLFVLGVMNLLWVTGLAVLVLLEKVLPAGKWVTRGGGAALLVWGIFVLLGPALGAF